MKYNDELTSTESLDIYEKVRIKSPPFKLILSADDFPYVCESCGKKEVSEMKRLIKWLNIDELEKMEQFIIEEGLRRRSDKFHFEAEKKLQESSIKDWME